MGNRGNEYDFRLDKLKGLALHPSLPTSPPIPHAKRIHDAKTKHQIKCHIYLQGQSSLVIGIGHPLLYCPGVDRSVLEIWEGSRLGILAGVSKQWGTGLGCRAIRVPLYPRSPWLSTGKTVPRHQTWRRRSILLHIWHRYHPCPAFRVLGIPPLFLRLFKNSEYITLSKREILLIIAWEIKKRTDIFIFQALWGTSARTDADEGGEFGLVDRLY